MAISRSGGGTGNSSATKRYRVLGFKNNTSTDDYHYILEVGSSGKVIGGRYCGDATNRHIDFLWAPTGTYSPSNPSVDLAKVKQLIKASVAP